MAKTVKRPSLLWFQGTVGIDKGGTGGTSVAQALTNLGYIPSSSLGQANGPIPLIDGLIPAEYLPGVDGYIPTVLGAPRQFAGSTRTLSITNYDSWTTYNISAQYGSLGSLSTVGSDTGSFSYTAPTEVPVSGKDNITINGINFDIEILTPRIGKPSVVSPVENYSGMLSDIGSFTSSNYAPGSTQMLDSISVIGNLGSFVCPTGTDKIRVLNRSGTTATVSQGGVVKSVPPGSELEWAGSGTWNYGVSGQVQVEFLQGTNPHASSDWQISTASDFSTVMYQSLSDTINKLSWANPIQQGGIYYVRVRHRDSLGNVSEWSNTRRIVPAGLPARQTSYLTGWTSSWYTNWITDTPTPTTLTSAQTDYNTSASTAYSAERLTSAVTSYGHNTSRLTTMSWGTAASWVTTYLTTGYYHTADDTGQESNDRLTYGSKNTSLTTSGIRTTSGSISTTWATADIRSTAIGYGGHYTYVVNDPAKDGASYDRMTYSTTFRDTEYGAAVNTSWNTSYIGARDTSWLTVGTTEWATEMPPTTTQTATQTSFATSTNTAYTDSTQTSASTLVPMSNNTEYAFATSAMTLTPWSTTVTQQTGVAVTTWTTGTGDNGSTNEHSTSLYSYRNTSFSRSTSGLLLTAWSTTGIRLTSYTVPTNTNWNTSYSGIRNTSWLTSGTTSWSTTDNYQQNTGLQTSTNTSVLTEKSTLI